jgi:intracellular septation protein
LKFFFDFFPVILFFVAFKLSDIFVATGVAIAATVVQIGWVLLRRKKVSNMQWMSLAIIVVFGGATLILRDETFIKWKPSVLYWLAGITFLGGLAMKTNLVKAVMGEGLTLPEPVWTKLCVAWGVFFLFTETWVNFKLFGGMGLMIAFVVAQALWLSKYVQDEPEPPKNAQPDSPKP